MKFGKFDVDGAAGAILAHSIQTPNGRMRKGTVIGADDIATLKSAGITSVTTALLEHGDVHENDAAQQFAQAMYLIRRWLAIAHRAIYGAREYYRGGPGVVQLDAARLIAANSVASMISVATVPEFQQMTTGGLVATIKIISYGVPQSKLEQACDLAATVSECLHQNCTLPT